MEKAGSVHRVIAGGSNSASDCIACKGRVGLAWSLATFGNDSAAHLLVGGRPLKVRHLEESHSVPRIRESLDIELESVFEPMVSPASLSDVAVRSALATHLGDCSLLSIGWNASSERAY